jgi:hypothetical protein
MTLREKLIELLGGSAAPAEPELEDDAQEDPEGDCPAGGEHEWKDVNAATSRKPLYTFCVRCRQRP